jgi:hypothetical protein
MKILETTIENLSRIEVKNGLMHLTIGSKLHTEKVDASKYTTATWKGGLAYFTVATNLGNMDVEASALEWEATRTTPSPPTAIMGSIKNFITGGCSRCGT